MDTSHRFYYEKADRDVLLGESAESSEMILLSSSHFTLSIP